MSHLTIEEEQLCWKNWVGLQRSASRGHFGKEIHTTRIVSCSTYFSKSS